MPDDGFYDGAAQQTADVSMPVPQAQTMGFDAMGAVQKAAASSADGAQGAVSALTRMLSYKSMAEADLQRKAAQRQFENEYDQAMQAAPGTARSLFHADGSLDTDKLDDFSARYEEALNEVDPGVVLPEDRARWDAEHADFKQTSLDRLKGKAQLAVAGNVKRVGQTVLAECAANNDWAGYEREVSNQNAAGLLTDAEARMALRRVDSHKAVAAQKGKPAAHLNVSPVQKGKKAVCDEIEFD